MLKPKQTPKLLIWATSALSLISVFLVIQPASAMPLWLDAILGGAGNILGGVGQLLMEIVALLIALLRVLLGGLLKSLLEAGIQQSTLLINHPATNQIWGIAVTIANGIFLLGLLIAAIAIITRVNPGTYNIKKILVSFITAVALSNFSLIIVKAMLALGSKIEDVVYMIGGQLGTFANADPINSSSKLLEYLNGLIDMNMNVDMFKGGVEIDFANLGAGFGHSLIQVAVFVIIIWILVKLALVLIERIIRLFILAITAPVVFAIGILPNFQSTTKQWWDSLIKWIAVLPLTIALILIGMFFFQQAGIKNVADITNISDYLQSKETTTTSMKTDNTSYQLAFQPTNEVFIAQEDSTPTPPEPSTSPVSLTNMLLVAIGFYALWMAGTVSNSLLKLGSVLGGLVETPGKAGKLIGKPISAAGRGTYNLALGTKGGRAFEGWRQTRTGLLGRLINPAGEKARVEANRKREMIRAKLDTYSTGSIQQLKYLDAVATKKYGLQWNQLDPDQQKNLKKNSYRVRTAAARLTSAQGATGYFSAQAVKETELFQMDDPATLMEDARKSFRRKEYGTANEKIASLRKLLRSAGTSREEKEKIQAWLNTTGFDIGEQSGYKQSKRASEPTSSTSDTELIQAEETVRNTQQHLQTRAQMNLTNATEVTRQGSRASTTNTELDSVAPAEISTLKTRVTNTDWDNFANKVQQGNTKGAVRDLEVVSGSLTQDTKDKLVAAAQHMNGQEIMARIDLVNGAHANAASFGGSMEDALKHFISMIENAQAERKVADNIIINQKQENATSLPNYQTTVTNALTHGPVRVTLPTIGVYNVTNTQGAATASDNILTRIKYLLRNNPNIEGKTNLDKVIGIADVRGLITMFRDFGVGADLPTGSTNITIDDAAKRLRIIRGMR